MGLPVYQTLSDVSMVMSPQYYLCLALTCVLINVTCLTCAGSGFLFDEELLIRFCLFLFFILIVCFSLPLLVLTVKKMGERRERNGIINVYIYIFFLFISCILVFVKLV